MTEDDDRLRAVLIEPQLACFRELCGLLGASLRVDFSGWHRYAVTAGDRVYLFPRHAEWVAGLAVEEAALRALAGFDVAAPRLVGSWRDREVWPYPFLALSRLPGRVWGQLEATASLAEVVRLMDGLGRAIASWHRVGVDQLAPLLRRETPPMRAFRDRLTPASLWSAVEAAVRVVGASADQVPRWVEALRPLAELESVLVHGDVHENQLLVADRGDVLGVLDWETAGVGHPLKDFDFGEWGFGIFGWEDHFPLLRRTLWESYARARGVSGISGIDWRAVHLFFSVGDLAALAADPAPDEWTRRRLDRLRRTLMSFDIGAAQPTVDAWRPDV